MQHNTKRKYQDEKVAREDGMMHGGRGGRKDAWKGSKDSEKEGLHLYLITLGKRNERNEERRLEEICVVLRALPYFKK